MGKVVVGHTVVGVAMVGRMVRGEMFGCGLPLKHKYYLAGIIAVVFEANTASRYVLKSLKLQAERDFGSLYNLT
ncbi:hypothetical protein JHK85_023056 [Glycine max]|nr:hypothetical protein JHK85_023056 [Glycine max]